MTRKSYNKFMNEDVIPVLIGKALGNKKFKLFSRNEEESWEGISSNKFFDDVKALASALMEKGICKGSVVGMIHDSSPRWVLFDLAVLFLGGVTVPLFSNTSEAAVQHIMENSEMSHCFIQKKYLCSLAAKVVNSNCANTFSHLSDMIERGYEILTVAPLTSLFAVKDIKPSDIATIIYTSGSTGLPKGVPLSHENVCTQIKGCNEKFPLKKKQRALSFLPLAHVFERIVCYSYLNQGLDVYFLDDMDKIGESMQKVRPHIMTAVPRLLEKMRAKILKNMREATGFKKVLIRAATSTTEASLSKWIIDRSIRKKLGGKLKYLIVGGAALSVDDETFFTDKGLPICTGYGLTEAGPVVSVNTIKHNKIGSVGKLFPNVRVMIDGSDEHLYQTDGEILVQSPGVTEGYHRMPERNKKLFKGKWLCTGDKGWIDQDGYLFITGRIKELFKTSNGKYVSPVYIEGKLNQHPNINASMIVGEGKTCVTAIIFADVPANGIEAHITRVNEDLNHWEQITNYKIVCDTPSIPDGTLTPTLKLKRDVVYSIYQDIIVQMYKENEERKQR